MKQRIPTNSLKCPTVSPWVVGAAILGALILAGIMFNRDYRREQSHLKEIFQQRGETIIHSLEMVARVRYGAKWEESQLLTFWDNLDDLESSENVLFLALTNNQGKPLATVGKVTPEAKVFAKPQSFSYGSGPIIPNTRLANLNGRPIYLVYRSFGPGPRHGRKGENSHKLTQSHMGRNDMGRNHMGRNNELRSG